MDETKEELTRMYLNVPHNDCLHQLFILIVDVKFFTFEYLIIIQFAIIQDVDG